MIHLEQVKSMSRQEIINGIGILKTALRMKDNEDKEEDKKAEAERGACFLSKGDNDE